MTKRTTLALALGLIDKYVIKGSREASLPMSTFSKKMANLRSSDQLLLEACKIKKADQNLRYVICLVWRALVLGTFSIRDSEDNVIVVIKNEFGKTKKNQICKRTSTRTKCTRRMPTKRARRYFAERPGLYSKSLYVDNPAVKKFAYKGTES